MNLIFPRILRLVFTPVNQSPVLYNGRCAVTPPFLYIVLQCVSKTLVQVSLIGKIIGVSFCTGDYSVLPGGFQCTQIIFLQQNTWGGFHSTSMDGGHTSHIRDQVPGGGQGRRGGVGGSRSAQPSAILQVGKLSFLEKIFPPSDLLQHSSTKMTPFLIRPSLEVQRHVQVSTMRPQEWIVLLLFTYCGWALQREKEKSFNKSDQG